MLTRKFIAEVKTLEKNSRRGKDKESESTNFAEFAKKIIDPLDFVDIFKNLINYRVAFILRHSESFLSLEDRKLFDDLCQMSTWTEGNTITFFVSTVHLDSFGSRHIPLDIYFSQYTKDELTRLLKHLSTEPNKEQFGKFANILVGSLYSTTRKLQDLLDIIPNLYQTYLQNPKTLSREIKKHLDTFELTEQGMDGTEFSIIEKFILVASWICGHNETKRIFMNDKKRIRKNEKEIEEIDRQFDLDELLGVTRHIAMNIENTEFTWIHHDLNGYVFCLVERGYLSRQGRDLFRPKITCRIEEEMTIRLAKSINVEIDKYRLH